MPTFTAFVAGLLFGIGLIISGMTDPSKVIGFLDLSGQWNPSLVFVMAGAVTVGLFAFQLVQRRQRTFLGEPINLPNVSQVDRRLVLGALAFGAGWGLGGYCPGPALTSLATGGAKPLIFTGAMIAGMGIFELLERWQRRRRESV